MAWRKHATAHDGPCPVGRRPYHTILTAQANHYQEWQTKIFYYHFRKAQQAGGPCTEMTGFTRLLAGTPDALMELMPTVVVPAAPMNVTRGFPVINRPWTMLRFLDMPAWKERIVEEYVYIAETDHMLRRDIPNRATPQLNVAFFFPYMSPRDPKCGAVAAKWYSGNVLADVPPVGPSPAIMHVDVLRRLTPGWYELSVALKANREADAAYGWMLEMWGYSLAAARLQIRHFAWQQLQIEPSAAWHQDLSAQDPFIYHYTFGVEYQLDGTPVVGGVGTWSLDKRHYFGAAPPPNLEQPPACAQESGWVWWRMFNEAIGNLSARGEWYARTGQSTQSRHEDASTTRKLGTLGVELVEAGPWVFEGGSLLQHWSAELHFFRRGVAWSKWGGGTWRLASDRSVVLKLCQEMTLVFDSATHPTTFEYSKPDGTKGVGRLDPRYKDKSVDTTVLSETSQTVRRLLGEGPWAFGDSPLVGGASPLAFLRGGVLATPSGRGQYRSIAQSDDVEMSFGGQTYTLSTKGVIGCYQAKATRKSDGHQMKAWVMMRHVSMEYTGWRDSWGCKM